MSAARPVQPAPATPFVTPAAALAATPAAAPTSAAVGPAIEIKPVTGSAAKNEPEPK